jgi:hypothetical protein
MHGEPISYSRPRYIASTEIRLGMQVTSLEPKPWLILLLIAPKYPKSSTEGGEEGGKEGGWNSETIHPITCWGSQVNLIL